MSKNESMRAFHSECGIKLRVLSTSPTQEKLVAILTMENNIIYALET
jgi:hypothetical protein